jgi:hypothetical protein
MLPPMITRPTKDQINAAFAARSKAGQEHTRYTSRLLKSPLPKDGSEPRGERCLMIGWNRVLGESDRWEVLYDPVTDQGAPSRDEI